MPGNATFRHTNTSVLSVTGLPAPEVHTSAEFDARIMDTLRRNKLVPGVLSRLIGIKERRWWPEDVHFTDAAAEAGRRALVDAPHTNPEVATHAAITGLKVDGLVAAAPRERPASCGWPTISAPSPLA